MNKASSHGSGKGKCDTGSTAFKLRKDDLLTYSLSILLLSAFRASNIGVDILPRTRSGVDKESSIRAGDRGHSGSQDRSSHLANKERIGHD